MLKVLHNMHEICITLFVHSLYFFLVHFIFCTLCELLNVS